LSWSDFAQATRGLFLWEAFVSGNGKGQSQHADAQRALEALATSRPDPESANAVRVEGPVSSLIGAALLRTGWSSDTGLLSQPCTVIKAGKP
jgi:hypothetical protein